MASSGPDPTTHNHHDGHHQPHHRHHRPLAESIAVSTRSIHAKLNKLIIARLPLALPPRSPDPSHYVTGLMHIAPIYMAFERLWKDLVDKSSAANPEFKPSDSCDPGRPLLDSTIFSSKEWDAKSEHQPNVCTRIDSLLQHLYMPGLMRSNRLKQDISHLTGWPDHVVEQQIETVEQQGRLSEFIQHIKKAIENKPHVLLAYSYILFMALFAGGRFIRASLEAAGEEFWEQFPSPVKPTKLPCQYIEKPVERASGLTDEELATNPCHSHADHTMPLRFLHFKSAEDGEDLKREFKRRLLDLETILTDNEKHDIIQEGVCIFENMLRLVEQLDEVCAEEDEDEAEQLSPIQALAGIINPISTRFRDSVLVTKERVARSSRVSTGSDESLCSVIKRATGNRRTQSRSSAEELSEQDQDGHPQVLSTDDVELCPRFSKSMRFEKTLPRPTRSATNSIDSRMSISERLDSVSKSLHDVRVSNWLMLAGFGAVVVGAVISGRGGVA
jgi:heme oxygenase